MKLNEMAMTRREAIDRCISLSEPFINHFHKVFNDSDESTRNHHLTEMQNWYDQVKSIKITKVNKPLNEKNLYDWFFTGGRLMADWFDDEDGDEINRYELFTELILDGGYSIKEAWEESSCFNDISRLSELEY